MCMCIHIYGRSKQSSDRKRELWFSVTIIKGTQSTQRKIPSPIWGIGIMMSK